MLGSRAACWASVFLLSAVLANAAAYDDADSVAQLRKLRDSTKDGILVLDDEQLKTFGAGKARSYSLIIFLSAAQVMDNTQLALPVLRQEFSLAAKALQAGPNPDSAFFVESVFEQCPRFFRALEVQQVPFIFHLPGTKRLSLVKMEVDKVDKMTFETVQAKYPWQAETMTGFFSQLGLEFAEVFRFALVKSPWFPAVVGAALLGLSALAYLLLRLGVLHHPLIYAVGSLGIFWFSVSGGMYNIIRGMPMFIRDKKGKMQFFLGSRGNQLGAEGFIMGSGYILFSANIALLTYAVPRVGNKFMRNLLSYVLVAGAGYMAVLLFGAFSAKTGTRINTYLNK
mmetsp:Transcript_4966/g.8649  ORF Transcript_4966/g.8649 Transcript_4966/m.8649 type:complete len:340 (+) Transcript_4966:53-1072(+)|eukprot:CAMPEP_0119107474 /NCGR_PEP_ID=MMETSP1180-20130426/10409_1 /TAXON_ID=3052 ORGANISM="Chlamydomonas cf sp, Strain CCMP681" /NCGR_SAMPLE_ID=MMETSP1180 /ASSEMBLY_ACC=CAM_ASM_000741 /LENGTH=339 /DNA_ID=CAMNT_0007092969 /DNA_START=28 /DNA_END=1047 /DNA_ORIENTATION=+